MIAGVIAASRASLRIDKSGGRISANRCCEIVKGGGGGGANGRGDLATLAGRLSDC